jgi:hypothetical protein
LALGRSRYQCLAGTTSVAAGPKSRFLQDLPIDQGTRSQPTYSATKVLGRLSSFVGAGEASYVICDLLAPIFTAILGGVRMLDLEQLVFRAHRN